MKLTAKEQERLTVFTAAEVARRRKERGVLLNHPETVAYISDWCIERAREGQSVAEIRTGASQLLGREDVMDGVPEMVEMIQVEPVFPDGTKLVTVHDPIRSDRVGESGDGTMPGDDGTAGDGTTPGDEDSREGET